MENRAISYDADLLKPLLLKPTLVEYVRQLIDRRYFIFEDAKGKAFRTTRDYSLWRAWLVLMPMLDIAVYAFIFGFVLRLDKGIESFISYLVIGVIFFGFLSNFLSAGLGLIQVNRNLIDSFNFPRATLVFSHVLRYFLDNLIPAGIAVIGALLLSDSPSLEWTIWLVVPLYLLMHIFGLGFMLIVARLSAFRPEVKVAVNLFNRAWFFISGVFFSIEKFVDHTLVQQIMVANPAYKFLTALRESVIYGQVPNLQLWGELLAWSIGAFIFGFVFFWAAEERYVRVK